MKPARATALITLALLLGACGGEATPGTTSGPGGAPSTTTAAGTPSGAPTPSGTPTPTATPMPSDTGSPDDGTADDETFSAADQQSDDFPGSGGPLLPVAVRTGEHAGFDRVVVDSTGEGTPGWRVSWVEEPIDDPRGQVVPLDGDAYAEVVITGLPYPEEAEYDEVLPSGTTDADDLEVVEQVHVSGIFEGQLQMLIGLDQEVPFRVITLDDPVRLVLDFRTD